jgi:hypothetical protein
MENEQRDFTTKATVHQTLPNLADLDEIMIVEETSKPTRTWDVQTNSWSSGTGSPKTKKVNTERIQLRRRGTRYTARRLPHYAGRIRAYEPRTATKNSYRHQPQKTKQNLLLLEKGIDGEKIHSSKGARERCNRSPKIMAMNYGHENWKTYHMKETTTKTEQKRKTITLSEKQDNQKESKSKNKKTRKNN